MEPTIGAKPAAARQDLAAMLALALGLFAAVSATAMPSAALPMLSRSLHADPAGSVWVLALYQIGSAAALLPAAAVVEIHGVRPVMLSGLVLFTAASIACAACPTMALLGIARALQGVGSAGVMTVTGALVRQSFPPWLQGRGLGIAAIATATGGALAPSLGAWLAASAPWPIIFAVNAVNGLAALCIAWPSLRPRPGEARRFSAKDAGLTSLIIALILIALFGIAQGQPRLYSAFGVAGAMLAVPFLKRQAAARHPVIPVDLLVLPELVRAYGMSILFYCAHLITFVALPFVLYYRLAEAPAQIGLLIAPMSVFGAATAPLAARLAERFAPDAVAISGLTLLMLGVVALATMRNHAGWLDISWRMAITGCGVGLFQTPNFKVIIACAPAARSGSAGGLQATTRLVGQALGSALAALSLHLAGPASITPLLGAGGIAAIAVPVGLLSRQPSRPCLSDAGAL